MHAASRALIAAIVVATLAVPLLLGGAGGLAELGALPLPTLAAVAAVGILGSAARAAKTWLLARRLDVHLAPGVATAVSLATDFAFLTTPVGLGGYAANVFLLRRAGAPTATATALAAADQVVDGLFFAVALPVAALCALGSAASPLLLRIAFASGAVLLALLGAALVLRRPLLRRLARARWLCRSGGGRFRRGGAMAMAVLADARRLLRGDRRHALVLIGLTALQWCLRYGVLWAALLALGHPVPYPVVVLAQALVMHAAQWSGVPGGAGAAEFGLAGTLAPWLTAAALAPALLLWRIATLHLALLAGALAWLFLARRLPRKVAAIDARLLGDTG